MCHWLYDMKKQTFEIVYRKLFYIKPTCDRRNIP